jgi:hypothetical protein
VYSQILLCATFVAASYQDIKERAVSDLVWIPALLGAGYVIVSVYPDLWYLALRIALVGAMVVVFTLLGYIGQADGIAFVLIATDPFTFSPIAPLFCTAVVAMAHIGYEYATGNARGTLTLPIDRFLKEQKWIPKAVIKDGTREELDRDVNTARDLVARDPVTGSLVEVTYGVPTVAYLGIGYIAYVAYLILFNQAAFLALP